MKRTTVIIPNYNGIKFLEDCLRFLHRSQETEFDTIVVDNGSTDGSVDFLYSQFPWVKVIALSENTGFAKAVNVGIQAAETEYVLLLNNDTVTDHYFVKELENCISSDEKIFSVQAKMLSMAEPEIIDDAGDYYCALGWAFARGKGRPSDHFEKQTDIFSACAGAAIYRREILLSIGAFDEAHFAYLEDIDVGYRALLKGYRNVYCPAAIVYHAGSGSSGSRYNEFKVNLASRNSIYLIAKNMPFLQVLLNLPFLLVGYLIKTAFFIKKGYGWIYIRGIFRGFALSWSKNGRQKHVSFQGKHFRFYCLVQILLWQNIIRRLFS